jgi:hypothetical protein
VNTVIVSLPRTAGPRGTAVNQILCSPARSALVLFVTLTALMLMTDPAGFLSTDVGGKIATLEAMESRGDLSPDLGYWAEPADPDGSLYPMFSTSHIDERWVNVTSLPMIYAAYPLYLVGGATLAGVVPVIATVGAALAAGALARRLGRPGWLAFWLVGLASPAAIYALDFWEHSIGLALMLVGVTAALKASDGPHGWRDAALAGIAFGLAATMRQEAFVYGAVSGAAMGVRLLSGGRVLTSIGRGAAMGLATLAMLAGNALMEVAAVGSTFRSGRATGTAAAVGSDIRTRIEEAIITGASPFARVDAATILIAATLVGLLVMLGLRAERPRSDRFVIEAGLVAIGCLVLADLFAGGLGFVPGLAATAPVAVLGATRCWSDPDHRFVAAIALGSLPLVWALQYTGGAGPQWGGRYILTTGALLIVLATVTFTSESAHRVLAGTAIAGAVITLIGVVWTIHRTHEFADAVGDLAAREEPALVFHDPFLAREGGADVISEQWLAATGAEARAEAVEVLGELGIHEVGFVDLDDGSDIRSLPGWRLAGNDRVQLIDELYLRVTTWRAPS